jgi:hypothetical protein
MNAVSRAWFHNVSTDITQLAASEGPGTDKMGISAPAGRVKAGAEKICTLAHQPGKLWGLACLLP